MAKLESLIRISEDIHALPRDEVLKRKTLYERLRQEWITISNGSEVRIRQNGLFLVTERSKQAESKNTFELIISDIPSAPWTPHFEESFDEKDVWIHPMRAETAPELHLKRARDATLIGDALHFPNRVLTVRHALHFPATRDNIAFGYLAHYIRSFAGKEPFKMSHTGEDMVLSGYDTSAPTRCLTMLNSAFHTLCSPFPIPSSLQAEILLFLLHDPQKRQSELKSMTSALRQASFTRSTAGTVFRWRHSPLDKESFPQLHGYYHDTVKWNGQAYYDAIAKGIDNKGENGILFELQQLREKGLNHVANTWELLISAPCDDIHKSLYQYMINADAWSGFTRTVPHLSHAAQIEQDFKFDETTINYADYLENYYYEIFSEALATGRIPTYEQYRAMVPGFLTNKSAGGYSVKYDLKLGDGDKGLRFVRNGRGGRGRGRGRGGSRGKTGDKAGSDDRSSNVVSLSFTEKLQNFSARPEQMLSREEVSRPMRDNVRKIITPDGRNKEVNDMGIVIMRQVAGGGKLTRPVYSVRLPHALPIFVANLVMMEAQGNPFDREGKPKPFHPYNSVHNYTVKKETGIVFRDHVHGAICTSEEWLTAVGQDFKNYDISQKYFNMIKYKLAGVRRALGSLEQPWGPWSTVLEALEVVWGPGIGYNAEYVSTYQGEQIKFVVDFLMSGSPTTINENNASNYANFMAKRREMDKIRIFVKGGRYKWDDFFSFVKVAFMGDDEIEIIKVQPEHWTKERIQEYITLGADIAEGNGFIINKLKTMAHPAMYEYLKKRFIYGCHVGLGHTQPFASERGGTLIPPIEYMRSYIGTLSTMMARGMGHENILNLLEATWAIKSGLRITSPDRLSYVYYPFETLWVPIRDGGCGLLPWSVMGANRDVAIQLHALMNEEFGQLIAPISGMLRKMKPVIQGKIRKAIAEDIKSNKDFVFRPGLEYIRSIQPPERLRRAYDSGQKLMSVGAPKLDDLYYPNWPTAYITNMIANSPKAKKLILYEQNKSAPKLLRSKDQPFFTGLSSFLHFFEWEKGDVVEPYNMGDVPITGLRGAEKRLVQQFGIATFRDAFAMSPATILDYLKQDPYARKDIQPETLFKFLSNDLIMLRSDLIFHTLVAMGFDPGRSAKVASEFNDAAKIIAFKINGQAMSLNDTLLPNLDLSLAMHERCVRLHPIGDAAFEALLHEVGLLYFISEGMRTGEYRQVIIRPKEGAHPKMTHYMLGKLSGMEEVLQAYK